jgi:hypothetical protein
MIMNFGFAEPVTKIVENVGFLMTFSLAICFATIIGCLCLKIYERAFPKQNSDQGGIGHTSSYILGHALKSFSKKF